MLEREHLTRGTITQVRAVISGWPRPGRHYGVTFSMSPFPHPRAARGPLPRARRHRRDRRRDTGTLLLALVKVLGVVGLRFGEGVALRRRHLDLMRRRLLVEDSLAEISGRLVFGPTKTHTVRSVPLPATLAAALKRYLEQVGPEREALVFTAPKGGAVRYNNFLKRVWRPTLDALGIPRVGVQVLRHSSAARMIAAGATPKAVQEVLGHRSIAFTLTVSATCSTRI